MSAPDGSGYTGIHWKDAGRSASWCSNRLQHQEGNPWTPTINNDANVVTISTCTTPTVARQSTGMAGSAGAAGLEMEL